MKIQMMKASLLLATLAMVPIGADDTQGLPWKQILLPGRGSVLLEVPKDWRVASAEANEAGRPAIEFGPLAGHGFVAHVSVLWRAVDRPFSKKEVLGWVREARDLAARSATTTKIPILQLESASVKGYYFTSIEKNPKPGEWLYRTYGSALLADVRLTFTALSNDPTQPEAATLLGIIKNAKKADE
jgi:hypothetical protein